MTRLSGKFRPCSSPNFGTSLLDSLRTEPIIRPAASDPLDVVPNQTARTTSCDNVGGRMTMTKAGVEPDFGHVGSAFRGFCLRFRHRDSSLPSRVWQRGTTRTIQDGNAFDFGEQGWLSLPEFFPVRVSLGSLCAPTNPVPLQFPVSSLRHFSCHIFPWPHLSSRRSA